MLVPVVLKVIILPALNVHTLDAHYRAINAIHVIGAYVSAAQITDSSDIALISGVMPMETWRKEYDCQAVDGLFFFDHVAHDVVAYRYGELNRLALRHIVSHPQTFVRHQLCNTSMLWKILPRGASQIGTPPSESRRYAWRTIWDFSRGRLSRLCTTIYENLPTGLCSVTALPSFGDLRYRCSSFR